jgi:hypothetical protein
MNTATLRRIFRTRLAQVADMPLVRYERVVYEGTPTVAWIDEELRPGTQTTVANGTNAARPLYLLTIHTPKGTKPDEADALVDRLADAFQAGRTLTDSDRTHQIEITSFDTGALRVLTDGWGYRRITIGATAWALRTDFTPA